MCKICSEWTLGKLNDEEAFRAIGEHLNVETDQDERDHLFDVVEKILDKNQPIIDFEEDTDFLIDLEDDPPYEN